MSSIRLSIIFLSCAFLLFGKANLRSQDLLFNCSKIYQDLEHCTLKQDSVYGVPQSINFLRLPRTVSEHIYLDLAYEPEQLIRTSKFIINNRGIAGINAGFFDMKKGGPVHYLEYKDRPIRKEKIQSIKSDSLFDGALLLTKELKLIIENAKNQVEYEMSQTEEFVLFSGPILITKGVKNHLANHPLVDKRHPRTCIALDEDSIILMVVDGRSKNAAGLSLKELQLLLSKMNCIDAINLDGGGSSTMVVKNGSDISIVNKPSDITGERKVANAIVIKEKQ